jgi:hypothetical protein
VLCVVLAVMWISVIYELSLGLWSAARSGQAKLKIARPSLRRGKQSKASQVMWAGEMIQSALRGARMDSFTAVLTTLSRSSMYSINCLLLIKKDNFDV